MIFSQNKTTLVLVHGIATALLIKQPMYSRALVLTNTGLSIYANNFSKNEKHINASKVIQFITGANLARQTIKNKQKVKGFIFAITSTGLDLIE